MLPDRLELRVVPLPPGADPADIVGEEGGAERMRALLDASGPVRALRDRAHPRARPRDDEALTRSAGHQAAATGHPPRRARPARLQPPRHHPGARRERRADRPPAVRRPRGRRRPRTRRQRSPPGPRPPRAVRARVPLALRRAAGAGREKLAATDLDAVFTAPLTRLAAERLRGHLEHPSSVIADAPELAELIPEIVLRAGQLDATPATLELEALQLDLHRLDREITAARTGGEGAIGALATERQKVLDAIRHRLQ